MTWSELKTFASWKPMRDFPAPLQRLSHRLVMISDCAFFCVVPYDRQLVMSADAPYISSLVWAQSLGAALRSMDMQIERDDGVVEHQPPSELLLSPDSLTYGSILEHAQRRTQGTVMEHAGYRIASDGAFIHRTISVGGEFEFHFRAREQRDDETPYAIRYSERQAV